MSTNTPDPGLPARPATRDLRIAGYRPLLPPTILMEELPLPLAGAQLVNQHRDEIVAILDGHDDRLIVVVGPCSIHDTAAAREYAQGLSLIAREVERDLRLVMRTYFEKPRTTVGWRGLINDPHLDGSFAVNDGLRLARRLLLDVIDLGLPVGCEFLDPISPQFFADLVAWAAIGARTTESQVHRNLASGLSMPVGFKNGTGGSVQLAIDAIRAAGASHSFLSVTEQGLAAIVTTRSNPDCHVVLRGGRTAPNYDAENVQRTLAGLRAADLPARVLIDASHDNSRKDHHRQVVVAGEIAEQVAAGEQGIVGVMLESFLVEGRQDLRDKGSLVYGQSITDSCMDWDTTLAVLRNLANAVQTRRAA
ncbi:MAG: 3-deoxy-7-phosphoheptulonate synthase [Roseiflexaceae bacterium]|nr:3-deoxy-7-phosphoheptulonate synthase [Roseiflexaceae bacterium]